MNYGTSHRPFKGRLCPSCHKFKLQNPGPRNGPNFVWVCKNCGFMKVGSPRKKRFGVGK